MLPKGNGNLSAKQTSIVNSEVCNGVYNDEMARYIAHSMLHC